MKLAKEIIQLLTDSHGSLTDALLKTKVLLHQIGHKDLTDLVNKELNGYAESDDLPLYRYLNAEVLANASNGAYSVSRQPIPLSHLTEDRRNKLEHIDMRQSLAMIEALLGKSTSGRISSPIPMANNHLLSKGFANDYVIQNAWCEVPAADVKNIEVQVRSRLLDFILEIDRAVPDSTTTESLAAVGSSIDAQGMLANAMFGSNTTIIVGNQNRPNITNEVTANDFDALARFLKGYKVDGQAIDELYSAIDADANHPDVQDHRFGPQVRSWLSTMYTRSVNGAWAIEMGIAGNLLTDALKRFYG